MTQVPVRKFVQKAGKNQGAPPLAESRRLLSYSHLFLTPRLPRFPISGEGVPGPMLMVDSPKELLRVRGDEDPKLWR